MRVWPWCAFEDLRAESRSQAKHLRKLQAHWDAHEARKRQREKFLFKWLPSFVATCAGIYAIGAGAHWF